MENPQKTTTAQIVLVGYLMVNIPITIIILGVAVFLVSHLDLGFFQCLLIGTVFGWIYWEIAVRKWIKWALMKNIDEHRLHKIGTRALLLWKRDIQKIKKTAAEMNS